MIAQVHSATLIGIDALPIVVEVDLMGYVSDGDSHASFTIAAETAVFASAANSFRSPVLNGKAPQPDHMSSMGSKVGIHLP